MTKPKLHKWYIRESPTWEDGWYIEREDGKVDEDIHGAHCKACAMVDVLIAHPSADCDLREFRHTPCYGILQVTVMANRRGEPQEAELYDYEDTGSYQLR